MKASTAETRIDLSHLPICVVTDHDEWKEDLHCVNCHEAFAFYFNPKHVCKFCHRGVCAQCSPATAWHPLSQAPKRVCEVCLQAALEKLFNDQYSQQLVHSLEENKRR